MTEAVTTTVHLLEILEEVTGPEAVETFRADLGRAPGKPWATGLEG